MRTSKPISTISYNSEEYLNSRLSELIESHKISDFVYIFHLGEDDESNGKNHIHLWLKPNTLLDTMDLQDHFKQIDPQDPMKKPLGCIDFRSSKIDDFILYTQHYEPYLKYKGLKRQYYYTKEDFKYNDSDNFESLYNHAFKGSEWARRYQILQQLNDPGQDPADLILSGMIPLSLASQVNALDRMRRKVRTPLAEWEKEQE